MKCVKVFCGVPVLLALWASGCVEVIQRPPRSIAEYQGSGQVYPTQTVVLHNLQRAMDRDLSPTERVNSLQLVAHVGSGDPSVLGQLATVLSEADAPSDLRRSALELLLKNDYPGLAAHVVKVLPFLSQQSALREAALEWLGRHPEPEALAEVIKLWAQERSPDGPNDDRFRQIVQRMSGKPWDDALLEGLNRPEFFARGSAMEILSRRLSESTLRPRISALPARTEAVSTLQAFLEKFDYMPVNGTEFLASVLIYKTQEGLLDDAAKLNSKWRADYGYKFNIRDFHLLSRMAGDPLRTDLRRTQLILELAQAFVKREHPPYRRRTGGLQPQRDNFQKQAENLSMSDLWNLYLLDVMLSRPRMQIALRVMAERDREDRASAWGGLVFYKNGQAEPKLYPPSTEAGENDLVYVPSALAVRHGRDALCRFYAHFDQADNVARAGPGAEELRDAAMNNYYALVLTSINENTFCAHYCNPEGTVVSLGAFAFGRYSDEAAPPPSPEAGASRARE